MSYIFHLPAGKLKIPCPIAAGPFRYSATKLPYWLHTVASSSEPGFHQPQVSHENVGSHNLNKAICQVSGVLFFFDFFVKTIHYSIIQGPQVENCNRRIKNSCATHVHICRFIQLSQKVEGKEISLLQTRQFRPSEGVTLGVLKASSHLNPASNGSTLMVPDTLICSSFSEKNILDVSNDTITMPSSLPAPGNSTLRSKQVNFCCYCLLCVVLSSKHFFRVLIN